MTRSDLEIGDAIIARQRRLRERRSRGAALGATVAGALISVGFTWFATFRVGSPALLWILFAGWVVTPFVALLLADRLARGWPTTAQRVLDAAMVLVGIGSVVVYGIGAMAPIRPKTVVFVLVAPASWLLIALALAVGALLARRPHRGRR